MLCLRHVDYVYHTMEQETLALTDISLQVQRGEFVAIVGPSGCGKSTLLNIIAGMLPVAKGTLQVHGRVGYMLQRDHLLEWRSIYRNITLGLEIQHTLTKEKEDMIRQLLSEYGLEGFEQSYPRQLSGGMRQRVALIRTLALSPDILLLDEPFSALDYQTRLHVANDIGSIIRNKGITAILVTHDLSEAISMADRVMILSKRPAHIVKEVPIVWKVGKCAPSEARKETDFARYFQQVWEVMEHDES